MRQRKIYRIWKELDEDMEGILATLCFIFRSAILFITLPIWVVPYLAYRLIKYRQKRPSKPYWD